MTVSFNRVSDAEWDAFLATGRFAVRLSQDEAIAAAAYNAGRADSGELRFDEFPLVLRHVFEAATLLGLFDTVSLSPVGAVAIAEWQASVCLKPDGHFGPKSELAATGIGVCFASPAPAFGLDRYEPFSRDAEELFAAALTRIGATGDVGKLAESKGLHSILKSESGGWVGRPNYTYAETYGFPIHTTTHRDRWAEVWADLRAGKVTAGSSATGLGQLLLSNCRKFYPDGQHGVGDPLNEAVGFIRYVLAAYRNPDVSMEQGFADAWEFYQQPRFKGTRAERPANCSYSWRSLKKYGGPGVKPAEGY